MKNNITNIARSTSAEIAHSDLGWFALQLLQTVMDTPPTREHMTRLILDATKELREIRRNYPPARPRIGKGA